MITTNKSPCYFCSKFKATTETSDKIPICSTCHNSFIAPHKIKEREKRSRAKTDPGLGGIAIPNEEEFWQELLEEIDGEEDK